MDDSRKSQKNDDSKKYYVEGEILMEVKKEYVI